MKEATESIPTGQGERENFANRKLIRPMLNRSEHTHGNQEAGHAAAPAGGRERHDRPERVDRVDHAAGVRKVAPPEQTNAENFYYQKQMQTKTVMVIVLRDGEEVKGVIEWYDRACIKVNREGGKSNLMIYKPAIKYMYKDGEKSA
jgi:host factor-I protein